MYLCFSFLFYLLFSFAVWDDLESRVKVFGVIVKL